MPLCSLLRARGMAPFALTLLSAAACGGGGDSPSAPKNDVSAVQLTSPIDTLIAQNTHVTLGATITGSNGQALTVPITWQSSDANIVSVDASGQVEAKAVGSATLSATAGGKTGQLRLRVVAPELPAILSLISDPLVTQFESTLTTASRTSVQTSINSATQAIASGNLMTLLNATAAVSSLATSATDPNDRAILATLSLFSDRSRTLLHLTQ